MGSELAEQDKPVKPKKPRGFAAMTLEQRRKIASQGGKAAQKKGTAHRFTSAEAVEAGRIGGKKGGRKGPRRKTDGVG